MPSPSTQINREIELISRFIETLRAEQDALKKGDIDLLHSITASKRDLAEDLNKAELTRIQQLSLIPGETPRACMERWLAENPEQKSVAADWKKLLGLATEAKQLHDLNGRLIGMHLQQANELLAALGAQPNPLNMIYGSNGQSTIGSGSRIIDSA